MKNWILVGFHITSEQLLYDVLVLNVSVSLKVSKLKIVKSNGGPCTSIIPNDFLLLETIIYTNCVNTSHLTLIQLSDMNFRTSINDKLELESQLFMVCGSLCTAPSF